MHDDKKLNRFYPHNVVDDMTRRHRVWARKDEFVFPMAAESAAKIIGFDQDPRVSKDDRVADHDFRLGACPSNSTRSE